MDRFFPLFITFLLFTALGCAKDKRAAVTSTPSSTLSSNDPCTAINCQQATPPELNATQRLAKNVQVSCKENDCDPSVGLLSIVDKGETAWSAGQCTASLIGSDILVTNGHCIPNDLAKEGSSCLNRLWITFPNDPNHPEYDRQIDCGQILFRKKEGGTEGSDYAYIKLARPSNRPVLRQSIEGFENETLYRLHKFNPIRMPGGIGGMFEKVLCRSMYESAIFEAPLDRLSPTSFFVDCRVIPGNSGAPIIDERNNVRGVIYAFVQKERIRGLFNINGSSVPEINELSDLNVGSNFACLTMPGDNEGRSLSKECATYHERLARKKAAVNLERAMKLRPSAGKIIQENAQGRPDILAFGWSLSTSISETKGMMGLGIPDCVNPQQGRAFLSKVSELRRPFFFVKASYDRYLRASNLGLLFGGFSSTAESLKLSQLAPNGIFQIEIADSDTGQIQLSGQLENCQK